MVYDKKTMNGIYQVGSGRIVTVTHDAPFVDDSISQTAPNVNGKFSLSSDNTGKQLTNEQNEYFKNSKMRDDILGTSDNPSIK